MAAKEETFSENLINKPFLLFIMPQRIQKRRLEDMKIGAKRKKFDLSQKFCPSVTHVVTEFTNLEQVLQALEVDSINKDQKIVKTSWFFDSIKAGEPVAVEDQHRIQHVKLLEDDECDNQPVIIPEWACQRSTPLNHFNSKFTVPLEILEKYAVLRNQDQDYSRALAFRRASCTLKSLPYEVTDLHSIKNIKDIGGHSSRVIKEVLEDGCSQEVEDVNNNPWFHRMKLFTSIFGVGPSTAKKWIEKGWNTLEDIKVNEIRNDWRVIWGVTFHEELMDSVCHKEADIFKKIVQHEADKILPGVIVELTGGFRRGKPVGHDVDLLLTHPELGQETGLLSALLKHLENKDLILCGNHEQSTFHPEVYQRDFKLSMRGQLDHFEKWLGICKFPNTFREGFSAFTKNDENNPETVPSGSLDEPPKKLRRVASDSVLNIFKSDRDWTARRVDIIISPYDQYFYALVGWTGNKQFNRDLRLYTQRVLNMKLTSHGLYDLTENKTIPASSEEQVFTNLNLPHHKPNERNC